ncbi:M48 family metallopeptidase [Dasania marina]|uniref:M48 family metallopeptidase n=1 Tax=Dasania marina TaxID=471499 RepID=UPI00035EA8F9|nr:M48 family metallopeptidase [Dasania marina]
MPRFIISLLLCSLVSACATSPTGRKQLMMVDSDQIAPAAAKSFTEMKQQERLEKDKAVNRYVHCVIDPLIVEATADYEFLPPNWDIAVFNSDSVNAFAMPGGKVGVYTALLQLAETPDQLAAVMGHEIGHVIARHSAERMSTAQLTVIGMTLAGIATANNEQQSIIMAALGMGAYVGVQLPFSRTHETEADDIGQRLMAKAGFDPAHAVRLWQLMAGNGKTPPELLSTHPDPNNRAERLRENLGKMRPLYLQAKAAGKNPQCNKPVIPKTVKPAEKAG